MRDRARGTATRCCSGHGHPSVPWRAAAGAKVPKKEPNRHVARVPGLRHTDAMASGTAEHDPTDRPTMRAWAVETPGPVSSAPLVEVGRARPIPGAGQIGRASCRERVWVAGG